MPGISSEANGWLWAWLRYNNQPATQYRRFAYIEFEEDSMQRTEIEPFLVEMLRDYHTHSAVDQNLFRQLGFPRLAATIVGDQRPRKYETRVGNLMEILTCEIAKTQDYVFPVLRLQFNPNPDQSMKGDDVLGFRFPPNNDDHSTVLVGEAKFRKTYHKKAVEDAYEALSNGFRPYPHSMEFVSTISTLRRDIMLADKVNRLRHLLASNPEQVNRNYLLSLGTVGRHQNPFECLEALDTILPNVATIYMVFQEEFISWVERVYELGTRND